METQINQHRPNISVVASAPGKVILHGEHSVVYGKLAVAASLGLRTTLTLTESSDDNLDLNFTDLKLQIAFNIKEFYEILNSNGLPLNAEYNFQHPENINQTAILNRIDTFLNGKLSQQNETHKQTLSTFLFLYTAIILPSKLNLRGMTIVIKSNLHLNSGMGSSASFAVTITAALYQYLKLRFSCDRTDKVPKSYFLLTLNKNKTFSNEELKAISAWAFFAEKIIHGNPSGIDNSTCTYGSIVEFRKGTEPRPLHLKHKLSAILIDTGVPKNTKVLVERAARKKSLFPEIIGNTLDSMEVVSVKAIECLKTLSELTDKTTEDVQNELEKEYETLGQLIDMNQNMLRILGASHPSIDEICLILESQGFHGKITGAGGGGFVLAVVPFRANEEALKCVQESLTNKKYDCWVLELGGAGVMIH